MFIHLGQIGTQIDPNYSEETVNAAPYYAYGLMSAALGLSSDPIILNPFSNVCTFETDFSNSHVDNIFNLVDNLQKPVYWHVSLVPSGDRLSVDSAITSAQDQMQSLIETMEGYNMLHLLAGFCLDNVSQAYQYADGSQWDRDSFNELVDYIHTTWNVGVAAIINPALDALSLFTPPGGRSAASNTGFTQARSKLCSSPAYTDWLIHVNPLYASPLCERGAFSPDVSRVAGMLQLMKAMPYINHCVVQGFSFMTPTVFDNVQQPEFTQLQLRTLRRSAYFLECCGVTNYTFCSDQSYGAYSDIVLHPGNYKPLASLDPSSSLIPNASGVTNIYLTSTVNTINVMRRVPGGTDITLGTFDKQFLEANPSNLGAYDVPVYVYPFTDAFGGDIRDFEAYIGVPPLCDAFRNNPQSLTLCTTITGMFPGDPIYYFADAPIVDPFDEPVLQINVEDHLADTLNIPAPSNDVGPTCYTYTDAFSTRSLGDISLQNVSDAFGCRVYTAPSMDYIYQYPPLTNPTDVLDDPSSW